MERVFYCECGQKMRVTPDMLGITGPCMRCGRTITPTEENTQPRLPPEPVVPPLSSDTPIPIGPARGWDDEPSDPGIPDRPSSARRKDQPSEPDAAATPHAGPEGVPKTSAAAVASLLLGILSYLCLFLLGSIPGIVTGHVALSKIKRNPRTLTGRGLAIAGLILSYLNVLIIVVVIFVFVGLPIILALLYSTPVRETVPRGGQDLSPIVDTDTTPSADSRSQVEQRIAEARSLIDQGLRSEARDALTMLLAQLRNDTELAHLREQVDALLAGMDRDEFAAGLDAQLLDAQNLFLERDFVEARRLCEEVLDTARNDPAFAPHGNRAQDLLERMTDIETLAQTLADRYNEAQSLSLEEDLAAAEAICLEILEGGADEPYVGPVLDQTQQLLDYIEISKPENRFVIAGIMALGDRARLEIRDVRENSVHRVTAGDLFAGYRLSSVDIAGKTAVLKRGDRSYTIYSK